MLMDEHIASIIHPQKRAIGQTLCLPSSRLQQKQHIQNVIEDVILFEYICNSPNVHNKSPCNSHNVHKNPMSMYHLLSHLLVLFKQALLVPSTSWLCSPRHSYPRLPIGDDSCIAYLRYLSLKSPKTPHLCNFLASGITQLSKNPISPSYQVRDGSFGKRPC